MVTKRILASRMSVLHGAGNNKSGLAPKIGKNPNLNCVLSSRGAYNFTFSSKISNQIYNLPVFEEQLKNKLNDNQRNLLKFFEQFPNNQNIESFSFDSNNPGCIVNLKQGDFKNGTVRITKPGVYILKENISFDPNPENDCNPTIEQHNSGIYPSIGNVPYALGFFAAITIECDGVILDLNGFTIQQSKRHFLQQRFYSNIEIASAPFIGPQGPGMSMAGNNYRSGNNVLIMNGTLGLSSHHGIHSNYNRNIVLHNLTIQDFQVGGIALNGLENGILNNVTVKNTMNKVPVLFTYSQARFMRKTLSTLPSDFSINIQGVTKTVSEIEQELLNEIELTKQQYLTGTTITSAVFANSNSNSESDGNVYGIVFNVTGVVVNDFLQKRPETVFTSNLEPLNKDIFLNNVVIDEITSTPNETVCIDISGNPGLDGYSSNNNLIRGPVGDIFNANQNSSGYLSGNYVPNVLANAQAILGKYKLENPDSRVGTSYTSPDILEWIANPELNLRSVVDDDTPDLLSFVYGKDGMAHSMKGNIGLFLSGALNIRGDNVVIQNVYVNGTTQIDNKKELGKYSYGLLATASSGVEFNNTIINNISSSYGQQFSNKYKALF